MSNYHSAHSKDFPDAIRDIIFTEKSLIQEEGVKGENPYNKVSFITSAHMRKEDVVRALQKWIPAVQIRKINVIRITKKQQSKKNFGYTYRTGSNRSAVSGDKKFIVTIDNYAVIGEYFAEALKYPGDHNE